MGGSVAAVFSVTAPAPDGAGAFVFLGSGIPVRLLLLAALNPCPFVYLMSLEGRGPADAML